MHVDRQYSVVNVLTERLFHAMRYILNSLDWSSISSRVIRTASAFHLKQMVFVTLKFFFSILKPSYYSLKINHAHQSLLIHHFIKLRSLQIPRSLQAHRFPFPQSSTCL
jgi:hypothetical protein